MKYDFSTIMDRKGKDSIAVDTIPFPNAKIRDGFDRIPMWVADMNFQTAPSIPEAVIERTKHTAYGYFTPRKEYYDAIIDWQQTRNNVLGLTEECIGYENGVLGGVISALNVFCSRGDKVLLHAPTYIGFSHSLENNGYQIIHSPLRQDEKGVWRMDFADMEQKLKEEKIHAAIFCSPHNPCGRVWERWEIEQAMELYRKYNVMVVSDEIWSDIVMPGHKHLPTQSISEDAKMRTVALYALIGAYSQTGKEWVEELCEVLNENINYAWNYIQTKFEGVSAARPEGTYMLLLDCQKWCEKHDKTMDELQRAGVEVGVIWQDGRPFYSPYGIRMNLALPKALVEEAFDRLDRYVFNVKSL